MKGAGLLVVAAVGAGVLWMVNRVASRGGMQYASTVDNGARSNAADTAQFIFSPLQAIPTAATAGLPSNSFSVRQALAGDSVGLGADFIDFSSGVLRGLPATPTGGNGRQPVGFGQVLGATVPQPIFVYEDQLPEE